MCRAVINTGADNSEEVQGKGQYGTAVVLTTLHHTTAIQCYITLLQ